MPSIIENKQVLGITHFFMFCVVPCCCILCLISTNVLYLCTITAIALSGTALAQYIRFKSIDGLFHRYKILVVFSCLCFALGMTSYSFFIYTHSLTFYNSSIMFFLSTCFLDTLFTLIKSTLLQRDAVYKPNHFNVISLILFGLALLTLFLDQRLEFFLNLEHRQASDLAKLLMIVSPTLSCSIAIIGLIFSSKHAKELIPLIIATFTIIVFHSAFFQIKPQSQVNSITLYRVLSISIMLCGIAIYQYVGLLQKPILQYHKDFKSISTIVTIAIILLSTPFILTIKSLFFNALPNTFVLLCVSTSVFFILGSRFFPLIDVLVLLRNDFEQKSLLDSLTNTANRRNLLQYLENNPQEERCVIFIDINDFKAFNDYYGHHFGDQVIIHLANQLRRFFEEHNTLFKHAVKFGRIGGDEFVAIIHKKQVNDPCLDILELTQHLKEDLSGWRLIDDKHVYIGISIGASQWEIGSHEHLIHKADFAMLEAKKTKDIKGNIFNEESRKFHQSRHYRREIVLKSFQSDTPLPIHYQKIIHYPSQEVMVYEALARLNGANNTLLYPKDFLDIVEKDKLHLEFLYAVIRSLQAVPISLTPIPISINIAPKVLEIENISYWLHQRLLDAHQMPENMILELIETEANLISDIARNNLTMLDRLGYRIALDDYGVGYSSLSRIISSPISIVKLDRSLVIEAEKGNTLLIENITHLAKKHQWRIIAEGVETLKQAEMMYSQGIEYMQGYYFSKPQPF